MTMIETLLWNKANPPIAKSQPHPMERIISNILRTLCKVKSSKAMISTTAMMTERMLSDFICDALPTAMTGPPIIWTSIFLLFATALLPHVCRISISFVLFSVSLAPYGESIITIAFCISGEKICPAYSSYFKSVSVRCNSWTTGVKRLSGSRCIFSERISPAGNISNCLSCCNCFTT